MLVNVSSAPVKFTCLPPVLFGPQGYYSESNTLLLSIPTQQRMAQEVLTHLKEHPDAWTRVDTILEFSQNMNTKVSVLWLTWHRCRGGRHSLCWHPFFTTFEGTTKAHKSRFRYFWGTPFGCGFPFWYVSYTQSMHYQHGCRPHWEWNHWPWQCLMFSMLFGAHPMGSHTGPRRG